MYIIIMSAEMKRLMLLRQATFVKRQEAIARHNAAVRERILAAEAQQQTQQESKEEQELVAQIESDGENVADLDFQINHIKTNEEKVSMLTETFLNQLEEDMNRSFNKFK
jgi:hypothetical protein